MAGFGMLAGKYGTLSGALSTGAWTQHTEFKARLTVWTGNFPMQIFDVTAFGNVGWRQKFGGLLDANGSAGGFVGKGTTGNDLTPITGRAPYGVPLVLGFDGSNATPLNYITLCALTSNIRTGADVNDVCRVTFDWEGSASDGTAAMTPTVPVVTWVTS